MMRTQQEAGGREGRDGVNTLIFDLLGGQPEFWTLAGEFLRERVSFCGARASLSGWRTSTIPLLPIHTPLFSNYHLGVCAVGRAGRERPAQLDAVTAAAHNRWPCAPRPLACRQGYARPTFPTLLPRCCSSVTTQWCPASSSPARAFSSTPSTIAVA